MRISAILLVSIAVLTVTISAEEQNPLAVEPTQTSSSSPPDAAMLDPVAFINVGRGRWMPLSNEQAEGFLQNQWPYLGKQELPRKETIFAATAVIPLDEQKSILDTHNAYRAKHGDGPLTWSDNIAKFGDQWLQRCEFKHSNGPYGENLAAGFKDFKSAIDAWYNEVTKYNFKNPGFSEATGHFTQVVWKSSKSIGCAKKVCPSWTLYICNYDPPGNVINTGLTIFKANVLPPKS